MRYAASGLIANLMKLVSAGFIIMAFTACSSFHAQTLSARDVIHAQADGPSWPPPPQSPRIKFIMSVSAPSDLGINKSWVKRTIETVFGKEQVQDLLLRPYGLHVSSGRLYVTDPGTHILHIFDTAKNNYFRIYQADAEDIVSPIGVAVDRRNGEIYLTDSILRKVFIFSNDGKYLRQIGSPDMFIRPTGIVVNEERTYIIDTHAHHVLVFNKDGRFLFSFGKHGFQKGDFNYPTNIFEGRDGLLYITDSMNFRVQIFDRDGKYLTEFGRHGDGSGDFTKPKGIAVDSEGHIYVADAQFDTVQIFDRDGKLLLGFGNSGKGKGQLFLPAGMFIDDEDRIYVADSYNNRVQIFQYLKETK